MSPDAIDAPFTVTIPSASKGRTPLAQLLHALNQPLTGLQCSMEVALARPRPVEQYMESLRQGLELTERMRLLVAGIREVVDFELLSDATTIDLDHVLAATVEELRPVAEANNIRFALDLAARSLFGCGRDELTRTLFRLIDSTVGLAAPGTVFLIKTALETSHVSLQLEWRGETSPSAKWRAEIGLLIAQAWIERMGGQWTREADADNGVDRIIVGLPRNFSPAVNDRPVNDSPPAAILTAHSPASGAGAES